MMNVGILRIVLVFAVSAIVPAFAWGDPSVQRQTAQTKPAKPPAAQVAKIESFIKDFGSGDFETRERAEAAIIKIGSAAVVHLRKHLDNSDPEIADRVAGIVRYLEQLTRITLCASKAVYKRGESIDLTATFKNEGVEETVINLDGLRELKGLSVIDPDGNPIKGRGTHAKPPKIANIKLAPGQERSVPMVAINRNYSVWYPKTKPVRHLRRTLLSLGRPDTYYLRLHRDGQVSNEVAIRILGPNEKPSPPAVRVAVRPADPNLSLAQTARLDSLIKDLGSEDFDTRERASAAILKIGPATVLVLHRHLDSPDAEIAARAVRIIKYLKQPVLISLRASKALYKSGEPINLTVTFKNNGSATLVINLAELRKLSWLTATDQDDNRVKWGRRAYAKPGKLADLNLAPGRERSMSILSINKGFHAAPRGKAATHLRTKPLDLSRHGTYYLRLRWDGHVSNEVTIEVLEAK